MNKTFALFWGLILVVGLSTSLKAQQTLVDIDPLNYYNDAFELFENKKYGSSNARFADYKLYGEDYLLKAQADLHAAMGAMKLRLKNTEDLFINYLNKYPELSEEEFVYYQLGKYNFDKKKYKKALEWLKKVRYTGVLDAEDVNTYHFMLAYVLYKDEEYDQALKYFKRVDGSRSQYYNLANYYTGYIYYAKGEYDQALNKFNNIKNARKFNTLMPVYITHSYLNLNKYDKVIDYGTRAIEIPKVKKAMNIKSYIAEAYFYKRDYNKAVKYYEELRDARFTFTQNDHYHYGYALFRAKKYKEAITAFSRINMKKDAIGQNIAYLLGTAYLMDKQKLKARNSFGFASKLDFDKSIKETSAYTYAKLSYELNFHKESINSLRDFISDYPGSEYREEAKSLIGKILLSTADFKQAMHIIESMDEKNADINAAYQKVTYYAGLDYFQNGNYTQAKNHLIKSIKTPYDQKLKALAYFWLGESYYNLNEYQFAAREYKNYLYIGDSKQTPYYSIAFYNIAYCHYKEADYENARTYFDKYIALEKPNKANQRTYDVILRLADCNFAMKNYPLASKYYNANIERGNQEIDYALFQLATIHGLMGNDDSKTNALNKLITSHTSSPYIDDAMFELANMKFIRGEFAQAKTDFQNLIKNHPRSPYYASALLKIGLSDYNLGYENKALEQLKMVVSQYRHSTEAEEALNSIEYIYIKQGEGAALLKYKEKNNIKFTKSEAEAAEYKSALTYIENEKYDIALRKFEEYLDNYPNSYYNLKVNYYIASCADYLGKDVKALNYFEVVNSLAPNEFAEETLKRAAQLYFKAGDFENALKRFKDLEGYAVDKENIQLSLLGQMRSNYKTGNYTACIIYSDKVMGQALSDDKNKLEANYLKAKSNFELKKYDVAMNLFEIVSKADFAQKGSESKYLIAFTYYLKEDYDNTISTIVDLKNNYSDGYYIAKGFILLSDVFVKMGDLFQAKHTLESIINNYEGEDIVKIATEKLMKIKEIEEKAEKELLESESKFIEFDSDTIK